MGPVWTTPPGGSGWWGRVGGRTPSWGGRRGRGPPLPQGGQPPMALPCPTSRRSPGSSIPSHGQLFSFYVLIFFIFFFTFYVLLFFFMFDKGTSKICVTPKNFRFSEKLQHSVMKFDFCYYGQVNSLRLKSSVALKWASKNLWGVTFILLVMVLHILPVVNHQCVSVINNKNSSVVIVLELY